jgi:hypothetical protein
MVRALTVARLCVTLLFVCAGVSRADGGHAMRQPLGVFAHISVEALVQSLTNDKTAPTRGSPAAQQLHASLRSMYRTALQDDAVEGLTVGAHWDHIQLSDPVCDFPRICPGPNVGYDWSYLDDAFEEAKSAHKFVELIITPGFDSPPWLLSKIPPCDGLFLSDKPPVTGAAPRNCGTVQFVGFPEDQRSDTNDGHFVLPLPWNLTYQDAWWDFLVHLNARYRDDAAFVAIAIAEPIAGSTEFILPSTDDNDGTYAYSEQATSHLPADDAWAALIRHSFPHDGAYQNSDQVFIDQWKHTIDMYEQIFSGVTIFLSPDAGDKFPKYGINSGVVPHGDNWLYATDCKVAIDLEGKIDRDGKLQATDALSCEAKTEILSYFVGVLGPNAKATEVGGMTASQRLGLGDIGLPGVKLLTALKPPILGGAAFDHAVTGNRTHRQDVGCSPNPPPCAELTPEEAAYNALAYFFNNTGAATNYGWTANGNAPIQYLQIDIADVIYALEPKHQCPNLTPPLGPLGRTSLQDLLNRANHDLFAIAGQIRVLPEVTCRRVVVVTKIDPVRLE